MYKRQREKQDKERYPKNKMRVLCDSLFEGAILSNQRAVV
jgi:hypothetical protein